jgi:hypothetical protein
LIHSFVHSFIHSFIDFFVHYYLESESDDSDGEFELHPLLTASHRSASGTPNSSAPPSPVPNINMGDYYNYPSATVSTLATRVSDSLSVSSSVGIPGSYPVYPTSDATDMHHVDYTTMWNQHNQVGYHYGMYSIQTSSLFSVFVIIIKMFKFPN